MENVSGEERGEQSPVASCQLPTFANVRQMWDSRGALDIKSRWTQLSALQDKRRPKLAPEIRANLGARLN